MQIWRPPKAASKGKDKTIKSISSQDPAECVKAAKKGASLYFTSPANFRNTYGKALGYYMGYDFASYFPGSTSSVSAGDSMTEIEVFISKKGNYTDWHLDF